MDGVEPKGFGAEPGGETNAAPKDATPKKRKPRHRKFIDLQKQPPKPKPLIQE